MEHDRGGMLCPLTDIEPTMRRAALFPRAAAKRAKNKRQQRRQGTGLAICWLLGNHLAGEFPLATRLEKIAPCLAAARIKLTGIP